MADPTTNPYLALLQQEDKPPSLAQILQHVANLGFGMAGGLGQAASTGGSTISGLGSGLFLGNQLNARAAQQAEQERMKRLEWQFKAQEHEDKRAEMIRKEKQLQLLAGQYGPNAGQSDGTTPGFHATPPQGPLMGPGGRPQPGPDLKTAGAPLVDYLVAQHNLSPVAAATLIGNLGHESPGFNTSQRHDGGRGFGLAGWDPHRTAGLKAFADAAGKPITDLQTQVDYAVHEMKSGKDFGAARAYAMLQQAKTPEQANAAIMHFFRPEGYTAANPTGGLHFDRRVANTRALLPQGRPSDPTTAPVPTVDPYAVAAPPPGPAPRPGLGPRATPPGPDGPQGPVAPGGSPIDPNAQPPPFVAQGGGEGEVVLPRIGLPFPAQARAPAPPGSVPFPTISAAPGGPVQPNYTPTPSTPSMAPSDIPPPPVPKLPDKPTLTQADSARLQSLVLGGHPEQAMSEYNRLLTMQRSEVMDRHKAEVEVWKQQQESRRHTRGVDAENARHARDAAERKAREDAAAALAKTNAERAAANQDVIINPATGQLEVNPTAVAAKKDISAAQGTDPSSKITLELAQDAIKRNSDWQKAGAAAGGTIRNLDIFTKLSEQVKTGKYAGSVADLKATLKSAGLNLEAWGIPNNVGPAQAMQMMSQRFALEMRQEMPGPMSDGDRKFMERGAISIENDPNANKIMAAWLKGNAEKAQDRAKFAREYMRSGDFKNDPAGIDDYVEQKLAGKDYFDHSVLPSAAPATGKTPWELELERRGNMNSAKPG